MASPSGLCDAGFFCRSRASVSVRMYQAGVCIVCIYIRTCTSLYVACVLYLCFCMSICGIIVVLSFQLLTTLRHQPMASPVTYAPGEGTAPRAQLYRQTVLLAPTATPLETEQRKTALLVILGEHTCIWWEEHYRKQGRIQHGLRGLLSSLLSSLLYSLLSCFLACFVACFLVSFPFSFLACFLACFLVACMYRCMYVHRLP